MNSTQAAVDNVDLDKLTDQDKLELRQFLNNQQQRSQIQSRTFRPHGPPRASSCPDV